MDPKARRSTRKRCACTWLRLYVHVRDWPANGELYLKGLSENPLRAFKWETGRTLSYQPDHEGIRLDLSHPAPDESFSVLVVEVRKASLGR
jgi:alpha-L-fucosidase